MKRPDINLAEFCKEIEIKFPFNDKTGNCYFLLSTDYKIENIFSFLRKKKFEDSQKKIAVLFGESNFISLAPDLLQSGISTIILADIEPDVALVTKHLLKCFNESNTKEEFLQIYKKDFPVTKKEYDFGIFISAVDETFKALQSRANGMDDFLHSEGRFQICKKAIQNLNIGWVRLDLFSAQDCKEFSNFVKGFDLKIAFCNFTNIRDYDNEEKMSSAVYYLLLDYPKCWIMETRLNRLALVPQFYLRDEYFKLYEIPVNKTYGWSMSIISKPQIEVPEFINYSDKVTTIKLQNSLNISDQQLLKIVDTIKENVPKYRYRPPFEGTFGPVTSAFIFANIDGKDFRVICFDDKKENGFKEISTQMQLDDLKSLLEKLPEELYNHLQAVLMGTALELPQKSFHCS